MMLAELVEPGNNRQLHLFSGVKGLVSHGDALKACLDKASPGLLLMSISPGEVDGLRSFIDSPFEMNLSDYEVIYGIRLSKYGEVMTPPPIYTEAIMYSTRTGASVMGIDMPQDQFDQLYTNSMKTRHLIRHSMRKKRVLNHDFRDNNEYEFAENWIRRINAVKGLASIDAARSIHMKNEITEFSRKHYTDSHLIILDYEFYKPVTEALKSEGWELRKA